MKNMRNALHACRPSGARAMQYQLKDVSWLTVVDIYVNSNSSDMASRTDLTSEALSPDGWSAMRVKYAKAVFSDRTVLAGINQAESVLNVHCPEPPATATATFLRSTKMKNHYLGLLTWRIEYLMQLAWPAGVPNPLPTLLYMSHVGDIFNNLLLCATERITRSNINTVEAFLRQQLQWFQQWRMQTRSTRDTDPLWELRTIATVTYNNLRTTICGYMGFCKYMFGYRPATLDASYYLPVLFANTSVLESYFSQLRGIRHQTKIDARGFQSNGTLMTLDKSSSALDDNNAYEEADCGPVNSLSYNLPSLKKMKKDDRIYATTIVSLLRALVKPTYRPSSSSMDGPVGSEVTEDIFDDSTTEIDVSEMEVEENVTPMEMEDEYDGEDDLMEVGDAGGSLIVHFTVPVEHNIPTSTLTTQSTDIATDTASNTVNESAPATTTRTTMNNLTSVIVELLYVEQNQRSILETILRHREFQHYYRLSGSTDYKEWFTGLFVSSTSSSSTTNDSNSNSNSSSSNSNANSDGTSALDVSNGIEKWLSSMFLSVLKVTVESIKARKLKHLSRIIQDHIGKLKNGDLTSGSPLSLLGLPPVTMLHLDIVYRLILVLVQQTLQRALEE
eukprot:gene9158-10812_t